MKGKVFGVAIVLALVIAMMASVSCSSSPTTPEATATATATATPLPLYGFETDQVSSWALSDQADEIACTNLAWDSTPANAYQGSGSVSMDASYVGVIGTANTAKGGIQFTNGGSVFSLAGKTISFWVNIPAALVDATNPYGVKIGINSNAWGNYNQKYFNITASGWQKFSWNLATEQATCGGAPCPLAAGTDLATAQKLSLIIGKGTGSPDSGAVVLRFDNIDWH